LLSQVSDELKSILQLEKGAGREVVQVDNDPHNKIEMYVDKISGDCIFCTEL